jgi:hypothetical protein
MDHQQWFQTVLVQKFHELSYPLEAFFRDKIVGKRTDKHFVGGASFGRRSKRYTILAVYATQGTHNAGIGVFGFGVFGLGVDTKNGTSREDDCSLHDR